MDLSIVPTRGGPGPDTSPRGWVDWIAVAGTVLLELGAFWLSFTALSDLARRADVPSDRAWVWPLIVDGIIAEATLAVVVLRRQGRRAATYPWTLLLGATAVSMVGNVTHASMSDAGYVGVFVAAVPPTVQLAVTHLTVELTRRGRVRPAESRSATNGVPVVYRAAQRDLSATPAPAAPAVPEGRTSPPAPLPVTRRLAANTSESARLRSQAEAWHAAGVSNGEIARHLGVHRSTVGRWFARPGASGVSAIAGPAAAVLDERPEASAVAEPAEGKESPDAVELES